MGIEKTKLHGMASGAERASRGQDEEEQRNEKERRARFGVVAVIPQTMLIHNRINANSNLGKKTKKNFNF